MFIPYRTDAPLYHWPYATVGTIAACAVLSIASWQGLVDAEALALRYDVIRPHQWITSNFLHSGVGHLIGNAIFLWIFGMIVEGKIGWWRYLAVFLGIGASQCAVEQLLFSGGASCGASAIVFGLMGMAMIWAPENEVEIAWWFWFRFGTVEAKVRTVAICYALWELFWLGTWALVGRFGASSELLHLMGFAVGVPLAIWMLRAGMVDCERWDWFSVRRGDHRRGVVGGWRTSERIRRDAVRAARVAPAPATDPEKSLRLLRSAIADADVAGALAAGSCHGRPLGRVDLIALADLAFAARRLDDAARLFTEVRRRFPGAPARVSLGRAQIALRHESRPVAALELLRSMDTASLTPAERARHADLVREAERAVAASPLELSGDPL